MILLDENESMLVKSAGTETLLSIQSQLYNIAIQSNTHPFIKIMAINKIIELDLKYDMFFAVGDKNILPLLYNNATHRFINYNSDLSLNFKINFIRLFVLYIVHHKNKHRMINNPLELIKLMEIVKTNYTEQRILTVIVDFMEDIMPKFFTS